MGAQERYCGLGGGRRGSGRFTGLLLGSAGVDLAIRRSLARSCASSRSSSSTCEIDSLRARTADPRRGCRGLQDVLAAGAPTELERRALGGQGDSSTLPRELAPGGTGRRVDGPIPPGGRPRCPVRWPRGRGQTWTASRQRRACRLCYYTQSRAGGRNLGLHCGLPPNHRDLGGPDA
jgi:hypothetical protein